MWKAAMLWMIALLLTAQEETSSREEKGQSQAPLSLSLRVDKPRCVVGEFFFVYVTIRNNSVDNVYLPEIKTECATVGEYIFFEVENPKKQKVDFSPIAMGTRLSEVVSPLRSGEEISVYFTLAGTYRMTDVGTYSVRARLTFNPRVPVVTEDTKKCDNYWKGELTSNEVAITVMEPKGVDREVLKIGCMIDGKTNYFPEFASFFNKYSKSQYFKYWAFLHAEMLADNFDKPSQGQNKALPWYKKVVDDYEVYELTDNAELAIARIYLLQGKKEEAVQQFRRVLELYPDTDSVSEAKKALKELESK